MTSFELGCAKYGLGKPKPGIIQVADPDASYQPAHIAVSTRRYRVTRYYKGRRYVFTDSIYDVLKRLAKKDHS